ncbi:MAG: GAF domain-containing protein [Flavobacteriales bacterium]|nr:GAF domain-containing protein [Flavobacteriales bacterium]
MSTSPKNEHQGSGNFHEQVRSWTNGATTDAPDWGEQLRILSAACDLITPELSLEEVIATIYTSVNQLMDAHQFAVGLYNEEEGLIHFKGLIEDDRQFPDVVVDMHEENRLAPWCILNASEIFINDMDKEYGNYVAAIPVPKVGTPPKAALYVPLRANEKIAGLIVVRSPRTGVYQNHHLHVLRTLGSFVLRTLALSEERGKPAASSLSGHRNWHWSAPEQLKGASRRTLEALSGREKEVLLLLVSGLSNKAIAEKLFVSPGTIKTHTLNIYLKMEVGNRTSAIMRALELGWFA